MLVAQGPRQVSPGNLMWAASITLHCCPRSLLVSWLCCRCFSTAFSLHLFARLRRVASKGRRGACPLLLANRKLCTVALNCHEMRSQCAEAACGQPGCLSLASLWLLLLTRINDNCLAQQQRQRLRQRQQADLSWHSLDDLSHCHLNS